jgi:hypothetical protein
MIRYDWEREDYNPQEDKFMQRFDENGNFVNLPPPEVFEELPSTIDTTTSEYDVVYDAVENKYTIKRRI